MTITYVPVDQVDTEVYGPPIPDDLTVAQWAAQDAQRWSAVHANVDEEEARLERLLAVIAFRAVAKTATARRERATLARRIRWAYDWLMPRMRKPGTEATISLPGGVELRTQAAGGKPKIEIDDEALAMKDLRRKGWIRRFTVTKRSISKTKLGQALDDARTIRGIRVIHAPDGFFINGKKVDPATGARVGKK